MNSFPIFYIAIMAIMRKFVKSFSLKFIIGLGMFCVLAAAANNLRAPEGKAVEWIGGQEVLEKPE